MSYVCGDTPEYRRIIIDGHSYVKLNLFAALQHFRDANAIRTLWVDRQYSLVGICYVYGIMRVEALVPEGSLRLDSNGPQAFTIV